MNAAPLYALVRSSVQGATLDAGIVLQALELASTLDVDHMSLLMAVPWETIASGWPLANPASLAESLFEIVMSPESATAEVQGLGYWQLCLSVSALQGEEMPFRRAVGAMGQYLRGLLDEATVSYLFGAGRSHAVKRSSQLLWHAGRDLTEPTSYDSDAVILRCMGLSLGQAWINGTRPQMRHQLYDAYSSNEDCVESSISRYRPPALTAHPLYKVQTERLKPAELEMVRSLGATAYVSPVSTLMLLQRQEVVLRFLSVWNGDRPGGVACPKGHVFPSLEFSGPEAARDQKQPLLTPW